MNENRFFRFVWRFNGIILMVAGMLSIFALLIGGYSFIRNTTRERDTRNIVNVQGDATIEEKWQLGHMSPIEGGPYVMIPLHSDQKYAQSYYSKSSSSARNYLFINSQNNKKHWLFDTNQYLIADISLLSEKEFRAEKRNIRAILYRVVKRDTNRDKRLTDDDLQDIALSRPNGKGYKEILNGIDVFIGQWLIDEDMLLIVYQRKGIGYSANVTLSDFRLLNESELPKVPRP